MPCTTLDASGGGAMAPVKREAERLVSRNWDAIESVAEALIERGELSGVDSRATRFAERALRNMDRDRRVSPP